MTDIMTLCESKNYISQIVGTIFAPIYIYTLTFFAVIETKPVEIVSEQTIDNI